MTASSPSPLYSKGVYLRLSAPGRAPGLLRRLTAQVAVLSAALTGCRDRPTAPVAGPPPVPLQFAGPAVWAVDDGLLVASRAGALPAMHGDDNPVWRPGQPIRLFGLPGETVAFQVVISAGADPVHRATVELGSLLGPALLANPEDPATRLFRPIERFVVAELPQTRRSGNRSGPQTLEWDAAAVPDNPARGGLLPDPLIPVELAPSWADYPMSVPRGEHRPLWIDLTLPDELPAGVYRGHVEVAGQVARPPPGLDRGAPAAPQPFSERLEIVLEVGAVRLPFRAVRTMVFFDPADVQQRTGSPAAVLHHQQLMHRHHLSTFVPLTAPAHVLRHRAALTGALYTAAHGYAGPGVGVPDDIVVLGAYGGLRDPSPARVTLVERILATLAQLGIRDQPGRRDILLYAVDEQCDSPRARQWRSFLAGSGLPAARALRIGHTCSEPPARQEVDIAMVSAQYYDPALAAPAVARGKQVWIYNGYLPRTGAFLSDSWPLSLRINPWLQVRHGIERWFYWESTFWTDDNGGGLGPYDPLARSETFHNRDGDFASGEGVLVYPGQQQTPGWRSLGFAGVMPSVRLKQWRRGICDMGYLALARRRAPAAAAAVLQATVPAALETPRGPAQPLWSVSASALFQARRRLFALIEATR